MNVLANDGTGITTHLSRDEAVMVNNALNEVCHGVHIPEGGFHARLGASRSEMQAVLNLISHALNSN